ncbi:N-ethylmaleimide reductase [Posidoniimonas polymericola]|uniref:N-ethylmaleimide reductase n=1 Tax=Posidoniimonas polymericola TaxID=2528002 RepID=A0A5C5YII8_9BACT|nr:alkene reductase [Posidoniimonas polymericola]TWT74682.1 N-ethylmaleimide reductase [Posidoniimonas polymericola]
MAQATSTDSLLSPYDLHGLQLKNRVVMAPLTRGRAGKGRVPQAVNATYYAQRASAGLIISEATTVSPQANGWNESAGIYTNPMQLGWTKVTEAVHDAGGRIFMQLWHTGRASHSEFHAGAPPVAPSAIAIDGEHAHTPTGKQPYETPRALDTEEIPEIVEDYRNAAARAKEAGFDGVEVHSANGYLLDEFLQSKTNHRDDRYGGSIENRYRMLGEVMAAVTEVWDSTRVGVRLSPNGSFNGMGSPDYREQFTHAFEQLDQLNLAYLHVMDGLGFGFHELGEPVTLAEVRKHYHGTLMGNCGYDRESADQAIASGDADLISFGRPFISNPDLAERFANGWPLAPEAPMEDWYSPTGASGYTDFPAYEATA